MREIIELRMPKVGDVYYKNDEGYIKVTHINTIDVHYRFILKTKYYKLWSPESIFWNKCENFLHHFNYILPEEYTDEINKLMNEDMIREIIE